MSIFKYITVEKKGGDYLGDLQLELVHQLKRIADELAKKNNSGVGGYNE